MCSRLATPASELLSVIKPAYFSSDSGSSLGPMVKTAGRQTCNFSDVMAWRSVVKWKGVTEIFVTFWKGRTIAFLVSFSLLTPAPVMTSWTEPVIMRI
ncbi:hypothetical protein KCU81_g53, partial [Aureobasidium melanogenum]